MSYINPIVFEITSLERSELNSLARLFHIVWGGDFDTILAKTKWAFDNDHSYVLVAKSEDNIIAARGAIEWPLCQIGGDLIPSYQFHGTCVHPDFRRRGIFSEINQEFVEYATKQGKSVVFNVSVDSSRLGYEKLGWKYLTGFRRLTYAKHPFRILKNFKDFSLSSRCDLPIVKENVEDFISNDLLEVHDKQLQGFIRTRYTPDSLKWRLGNPTEGYRLHMCNDGIVVYKLKVKGRIKELIVGDVFLPVNNLGVFREAIKSLLLLEDPDICTTYISYSHPYYKWYSKKLFMPNPFNYNLNLGVRVLSSGKSKVYTNSRLWALSYLDIDTF